MVYIPKIDDNLEILTDEEVKYFVVKNFNETIRKEENLRKAAKSLYIFVTTIDNWVHRYNIWDFESFWCRITTE